MAGLDIKYQIPEVILSSIGNLFGSMAGNILNGENIFKGINFTDNLQSLGSTGVGIGANLLGSGITSLGGNSRLSTGIGNGVGTAIGTIGSQWLTNGTPLFSNTISKYALALKLLSEGKDATKALKGASAINPWGFGMSVAGNVLQGFTGPSKEYGGEYGGITKGMDTAYDAILTAVNFVPGYGQVISGAMALNKGLSNVFGSTDAMTLQDSILGSAFAGPLKWLNTTGSRTTDKFYNSWLAMENSNRFMQNGFGNFGENLEKAMRESDKTYGRFSRGAWRRANNNIAWTNNAYSTILGMADLNELQNIRSQAMDSINTLRYAQWINGGYRPIVVGKQGMKVFNNQTNHYFGLRLLSAAALIDNKLMILSAQGGTKIIRPRPKHHRKGELPTYTEEELKLLADWDAHLEEVRKQQKEAIEKRHKTNARHAQHYSNLATEVAETAYQNTLFEPVTQESLQNSNTEQVKQELLADKNEYFNNGMKFVDAVAIADLGINVGGPLVERGFRWAFNKVGLLVKVPVLKTSYSVGLPGYPYYYNTTTNQWDFSSAASDVKQGINNLKEWMNNPIYRKAAEANKAEAEAMGLTYIPYYERPEYTRALENPNIRFKNLNSSVGGESNSSGEVTINTGTTLNPILVVRHEMGHVAGLGTISEAAATNPNNTLLLKELKYLRYKSNQVYKEGSEYAGQVDLNRNSFEGMQNARDFGEELGIKIGQEYPGYEKALEIINSYPKNGFKAGLKKMFRLDKEHMPYVWKALTGTLFALAPTLYNTKHKKGGKLLKAQKDTALINNKLMIFSALNGTKLTINKHLPEVVVTPTNDASWLFSDGKFEHNTRKPLADKYTRKIVSNYLSEFDNENAKDYNARISRLVDVLDIRGTQFVENKVKSGKLKGRAHYINESGTAYVNNINDVFAEVAHPWLFAKGNNNIIKEVREGNYDSDSDPRGGTRYAYPDTVEGETHSFFEPTLLEWIETGKIGKSSPLLNKKLSKQKIQPKDRMEVADSAASWNRQAIDKRILANPNQLPLWERIKYSFVNYPLLYKSK